VNQSRGFTLIEVVIAAGILVCGLVAVTSVFSFVIRINNSNRQMAVAGSLLSDKMEEFRSTAFTDAIWTKTTGSETLVVAGERYTRVWQEGSGVPRSVTVVVYVQGQALTRRSTELIRATTLFSPTF
jgi:type II secretory pathway pseudopilin PulG